MKTTSRLILKLREHQAAALALLAALALAACGGGGSEGGHEESRSAPLAETAEVQLAAQIVPTVVTMTKVNFSNSEGQALTGFMFKDASATPKNAAVVMMHGCAGVWSNGVISTDAQPAISKLSHIHKRWGENLARAGYVGLLVDSFTSRSLSNECDNGASGLNEATKRPKDALAGRQWLISNSHVAAGRVALLGWSNGASAVMATMDQNNEGSAGAKPFKEAFAFYPGCGLINEFGGDAMTLEKTSWLPYAPITIHHASIDPLYTVGRCANRVNKAATLGAGAANGNAVGLLAYTGARHSFDQIDISKAIASPYTSSDKTAQETADASVMARLAVLFGS